MKYISLGLSILNFICVIGLIKTNGSDTLIAFNAFISGFLLMEFLKSK